MNRLELKIEHYKQRVAQLTVEYEERVADARVQLTEASNERDAYKAEVENLRARLEEVENPVVSEENDTETD